MVGVWGSAVWVGVCARLSGVGGAVLVGGGGGVVLCGELVVFFKGWGGGVGCGVLMCCGVGG